MSKGMILVSVLGAPGPNGYKSIPYSADGWTTRGECQFPQTALCERFEPSAVVLISTPESDFELAKFELECAVLSLKRPGAIRKVDVPSSATTDPDWLMATLGAMFFPGGPIPPGSSIHLDVTTGLRSITTPLLLTAILKETGSDLRIARLTYTHYVGSRGIIVDLTRYLILRDLGRALDRLEAGDLAGFFARLPQDLFGPEERQLQTELARLAAELALLRTASLLSADGVDRIRRIRGLLLKRAKSYAALDGIATRSAELLEGLLPAGTESPDSPRHFARIVRWFHDRRNAVVVALLLGEGVKYLGVRFVLGRSYPDSNSQKDRELFAEVRNAIDSKGDRTAGEEWHILSTNAKDLRDSIAHASLVEKSGSAESLADLVERFDRFARRFPLPD